jgi:rSAM/selenodomain-associated transferase 2
MNSRAPFISVIVPVLNEAALLEGFLSHLRALDPEAEIIVIDGGSSDKTIAIAERLADRAIVAPRGRASQMNAGAAIAQGEVLWFLHADLAPPRDSIAQIAALLANPNIAGGYFRLRFPRQEWIYRVSDSVGNLGVDLFGFALGDHGIFCRRSAFDHAGPYPIVPILEDAELCRRLRRVGRMTQLPGKIVSSPRTFETWGPYRTTSVYFLILVLYVGGVPIVWLNRIYRGFHRQPSRIVQERELAHAGR